jgi:hypothetical protein
MAEAHPQSLQIHPDAADPLLAQQQARFNTLVQDIALWRAALAEWKDRIARWQQAVEPVRRELHAAWREWVLALDHASLQPGLMRSERRQLSELLREAVAPLLEEANDREIEAVAQRHAEETGGARQEATDPQPPQDLAQDWEQQAAAAAAQRAQWAAQRRAASASRRRRQQEQEVSWSVRDASGSPACCTRIASRMRSSVGARQRSCSRPTRRTPRKTC